MLTDAPLAHSANVQGVVHTLTDHLRSTGDRAATYAAAWGRSSSGQLVGLLHDLGKADPDFQRYLAGELPVTPGVGHAAAGAIALLDDGLVDEALAVLAHHSGLADLAATRSRIDRARNDRGTQMALKWAGGSAIRDWRSAQVEANTNRVLSCDTIGQRRAWIGNDLAARWLLSALVDADRLDTEVHFDPARAAKRTSDASLAIVEERFRDRRAESIAERSSDPVVPLRAKVREAVIDSLINAPIGMYTLTAPTGSGKTLTVIEAALAHARVHGLRRVVMAAPFTSVVSQIAEVMRDLMDADGDAVLEHHSNVDSPDTGDADAQSGAELRRRLATENWDRPVVATTTVQLLETLFSNHPSKVRKLHRLAESVIIVDEVQSIPWDLLNSSIRMLAQVSEIYRATVVLCTATQPPITALSATRDRKVVELVPAEGLSKVGESRVRAVADNTERDLEQLAHEVIERAMPHGQQCLAVMNTILDAEALYGLLVGTEGLHLLTTRLCGAHRRDVLRTIQSDLVAGRPSIVVSTQLIEAGVDIDFPTGFRALAPLPAIVQTAGRINRHGLREQAELRVVSLADGRFPPGEYQQGARVTAQLVRRGLDLLARPTIERYYQLLLDLSGEAKLSTEIDAARARRDFATVAEKFRVIADDTVAVVCPYGGFDPSSLMLPPQAPARQQLAVVRAASPFLVSLRRRDFDESVARGLVRPIAGTPLHEWLGSYRDDAGLALTPDQTLEVL